MISVDVPFGAPTLEGAASPKRVGLVEWDSLEQAEAFIPPGSAARRSASTVQPASISVVASNGLPGFLKPAY